MSGGGELMGGTLTSSELGAPTAISTAALTAAGTGGRAKRTVGTLLGPEGAGIRNLHRADPAPNGRHAPERGESGIGYARTLRTAQWTRASLWLSYKEHTVDA